MDKSKLIIVIASDVDYENLIAEVYYGDEYIGLVHQESGIDNLQIEFSLNTRRNFDLDWLQYTLSMTQKKLINKNIDID